jgi:hypothetical protein
MKKLSVIYLASAGLVVVVLAQAGRQSRVIKPDLGDTIKASIYADNWFQLYINGKQVAVDPIDFLPHNVVTLDILPQYPMTIAVMAMDNADPKTGCEYGTSIGDGGFILKFSDGTVSNATWKAKTFFKGPLNGDTTNPKIARTPIPKDWFAVEFNDSDWASATEFSEQEVGPKKTFYDFDFKDAKFIWDKDLALDNTVIFRTRIEKPGWKPRWTTKPDLDISRPNGGSE